MGIDKPDNQLGFLLMQASLLKQRVVNAALRELDITYMQFVVLAGVLELGENNGCVMQQDLASQRRLDKAMVSNVVKNLMSRNLLIRMEHPSDKRAWKLSLTEQGRELAIEGKGIAKGVDSTFFAGIDNDLFVKLLEKVISDNSFTND